MISRKMNESILNGALNYHRKYLDGPYRGYYITIDYKPPVYVIYIHATFDTLTGKAKFGPFIKGYAKTKEYVLKAEEMQHTIRIYVKEPDDKQMLPTILNDVIEEMINQLLRHRYETGCINCGDNDGVIDCYEIEGYHHYMCEECIEDIKKEGYKPRKIKRKDDSSMKWMDKLERKLGKYAIPNLMFYVIILYAVGFLLGITAPNFYADYLSLDIYAVLHGQVWRLITFIMQPPNTSLLFILFTLYLYYMIGQQLEHAWGTFRFNLYFFMGVVFHIVAAVLVYLIFKVSLPMGTYYLNLSLFFAYAALYPNQQFYLFMIIPVKVKWLAWIDAAFFGYTILQAFLPSFGGMGGVYGLYYKAVALEATVSFLNFLLFYFSSREYKKYAPKEARRRRLYRKEVQEARQNIQNADGAKHKCAVCGRTELDDPNLEFRYCSKCNGNYEYCQDHLFTHEHIK